MDLRWLEDVLVLLEEGNLTRAADRRAITQPAFSRRIRAFEHWLGEDVLERRANQVRIRDSLRANEEEIRALIARLNDLRRRARWDEETRTHVTFAAQHALTLSTFTDIMTLVNTDVLAMTYRLRTANRGDCLSIFLRGDADVLLCYESSGDPRLPFDESFEHFSWGSDRLVPVVGGSLMYGLDAAGRLPDPAPVIAFPTDSYFGQTLARSPSGGLFRERPYTAVCESAFSAGVREMVLRGIGLAWIPMSLVWRDIESGRLLNLSDSYGSIALDISLYSRGGSFFSRDVLPRLRAIKRGGGR